MKTDNKRNIKPLIGLIFAIALMLGGIVFYATSHGGRGLLVQSNGNEVGGSFRIVSLGESVVTEGDFRGSWMLVWFFDTNCPDSRCQPVLKSMEQAYQVLHHQGVKVSPIVVSFNPFEEADTLKDYVLTIAPHVMPYTATPDMTKAMADEFHVPYKKEGDYYEPAPRVIIMDPQGHYAGTVDATGDAQALIARLQQITHK
ncbi:SCO family protein [Swingsia samuiensis]|uniref:SCO family protein n=1 Tax=Swingsia samuiensis TaxID=1293412 RepID=A0A4Y6UKX5_9PROT|nr:SCO family protein [Swingsia samuiensis]QDH17450.1 SCO family protein [Swingsia samuiensis]